jgi:hypothetical protein
VQVSKCFAFLAELVLTLDAQHNQAGLQCLARLLIESPLESCALFPDTQRPRLEAMLDHIRQHCGRLYSKPFPPGLTHGNSKSTVAVAAAIVAVMRLSGGAFSSFSRHVVAFLVAVWQTGQSKSMVPLDMDASTVLLAGVFDAAAVHLNAESIAFAQLLPDGVCPPQAPCVPTVPACLVSCWSGRSPGCRSMHQSTCELIDLRAGPRSTICNRIAFGTILCHADDNVQ